MGCSHIPKDNEPKNDLYVHYFTCDSTGVEKSEFNKDEIVCFGLTIKNISTHSIPYKKAGPPTSSYFNVVPNRIGSKVHLGSLSGCPESMYKDYLLKPKEQLFEIHNYWNRYKKVTGEFVAEYNINVRFDRKHMSAFYPTNGFPRFRIYGR